MRNQKVQNVETAKTTLWLLSLNQKGDRWFTQKRALLIARLKNKN